MINKLWVAAFLAFMISCSSQNQKNESASNNMEPIAIDVINEHGQQLFQSNCASCHNMFKDATGPVLSGTLARIPNKQWLYDWIANPNKLIEAKDPYAVALFDKWNKAPMTAFPNLTHAEIDSIMQYCDSANSGLIVD